MQICGGFGRATLRRVLHWKLSGDDWAGDFISLVGLEPDRGGSNKGVACGEFDLEEVRTK
jgi:hypothetical protein